MLRYMPLMKQERRPRVATIYVTLEPCSHHGKTPPCAEKIVSMGVKKCVIAMLDPNPLVAGKGVKILQDAGIEVSSGLLENEAIDMNRVFLKYIQTGNALCIFKGSHYLGWQNSH